MENKNHHKRYRIEVFEKEGFFDAVGEGLKKDIIELGVKTIEAVDFYQIYYIFGSLDEGNIRFISENLLTDKVTQDYDIFGEFKDRSIEGHNVIEVKHNPGVMDPVEESAMKAIKDMGITNVSGVRTSRKFVLKGKISKDELELISEKLLYNKVVQHIVKEDEDIEEKISYNFKLITVDMINASNDALLKISKDGQLYLTLDEMLVIKEYFKKLKRNPTDCELETIAQTWSEHCSHKTLRGQVAYEEELFNGTKSKRIFNNLLKETIMKVTDDLSKPYCVSVFKDNAGIIKFDNKFNICFKVETHNHPSALEPYGGAGTGIGGVIRDILGTGCTAKPIANTDIFCFAEPDHAFDKLPKGVLHPKRIMKGVVSGVRDYGNRMGIPTVNGAVLFDERYLGNPLVFCGTVGIIPKNKSKKVVNTGDLVVVVGGRTGRDGIHGATFSSGELTVLSEKVSSSSVQIGNPITEKKVTEAILKARDKNLFRAITDCGAGGLSSAVGEMGEDLGARVDIDKVPLKYEGLSYAEIWISEAQERMVLAVPPDKLKEIMEIFETEDVEAVVIGEFTNDLRLKLFYKNTLVCDLNMQFLHKGIPKKARSAFWKEKKFDEPKVNDKDLKKSLLGILSDYSVASKEWIIRQYDHEVQGGSVIKPLVGAKNDGPSDAAIIKPILDSKKGVVISCGINPRFGLVDPYWMAASVIDEALRQVISVGGDLKEAAILDNFCWGNTEKAETFGELVRASVACYDIAKGFGVPFISGKDSLNNEYNAGDRVISIPPTLLISCVSVMSDVSKAITMDAKSPGNLIYIIGLTKDELGGSYFNKLNGGLGNNVPKVDVKTAKKTFEKLSGIISKGIIRSCHDLSEGGLAVALSEMAFSGDLGMDIDLKDAPKDTSIDKTYKLLFSESNSRFIVEIKKENKRAFEKMIKGVPFGFLGELKEDKKLKIKGLDGSPAIDIDIDLLKEAWQKPFRNM